MATAAAAGLYLWCLQRALAGQALAGQLPAGAAVRVDCPQCHAALLTPSPHLPAQCCKCHGVFLPSFAPAAAADALAAPEASSPREQQHQQQQQQHGPLAAAGHRRPVESTGGIPANVRGPPRSPEVRSSVARATDASSGELGAVQENDSFRCVHCSKVFKYRFVERRRRT